MRPMCISFTILWLEYWNVMDDVPYAAKYVSLPSNLATSVVPRKDSKSIQNLLRSKHKTYKKEHRKEWSYHCQITRQFDLEENHIPQEQVTKKNTTDWGQQRLRIIEQGFLKLGHAPLTGRGFVSVVLRQLWSAGHEKHIPNAPSVSKGGTLEVVK